ncbi:methyl farnesoate epoxidase-like [Schistocerca serialis cubense]|uniref:methyl farnesoate epoxidase-like n=1 Tax=Schistocerca serialis cubense TaxID=2023355 RepID=UPI00214E3025|nr:methyl farnesoate epoxidase-like [Schistocerca serialis cubense]
MYIIYLGIVIALAVLIYFDTFKPHRFPPGPKWLPLVGNYLHLQKLRHRLGYLHLVWDDLALSYGPIIGLRLGNNLIAVICGKEAASTVLSTDAFDGRPDGFFFQTRTFNKRLGVVFTDGTHWLEQRRFLQRRLRDPDIAAEACDLVDDLAKRCQHPVPMHTAFDICVLNSLWAMLAGKRFALNDHRLSELLNIVHSSFRATDMSGGLLNQMPYLRFIAPRASGYVTLVNNLQRMWNFMKETIHEHETTLTAGCPRDLIDSFLLEKEEDKNKATSSFTDEQLLSVCLDLFMAGSETTSNTLSFAILYMMRYPEIQQKVQAELDSVVGRTRLPSLADRSMMPYTEAVLMEIQRRVNTAPTSVAHRAVCDTELFGYKIPKGTTILVSIWSVHMDKQHWGDPENFRPDRFIGKDGKIKHDTWFLPFGLGRRRCLGEGLARSTMFLFFSTVLHSFSISVPAAHPVPSLDGYDGVTLSPKPFYATLTPRL